MCAYVCGMYMCVVGECTAYIHTSRSVLVFWPGNSMWQLKNWKRMLNSTFLMEQVMPEQR